MSKASKKSMPGPKPDVLHIEGDWREAMKKALKNKELQRKRPKATREKT